MIKRTFTPHVQLTEDVTPGRVEALAERTGMKKQVIYMRALQEGLKVLEAQFNLNTSGTHSEPVECAS